MKFKYIYKNKKTGKKTYTNEQMNDKDLVLIAQYKGQPFNKFNIK